jgi:thiosulfate reductase cytochrome b subunit
MATLAAVCIHAVVCRVRRNPPGRSDGKEGPRTVRYYPLHLRAWHWLNTASVLLLMLTGLTLRDRGRGLFSYGDALNLHGLAGLVMAACFLFWLLCAAADGSIRHYAARLRNVKTLPLRAWGRVRNPGGSRLSRPPDKGAKRLPLRRIADAAIQLVVTPLAIVTGCLSGATAFFAMVPLSGHGATIRSLHLAAAYLFLPFLIVHVYASTLGSTPLDRIMAMVRGRPKDPR